MSESSGGATGLLGVLLGAFIVVGLGFFFLTGGGHGDKVNVRVEPPAIAAPAK
ncbi:MAG: hypothetical protein GX458_06945 [Phyllobacteriaceae bacterium]|nr:hypothetical protein [Phyllobacteriaceae bacterium]